MAFCPEPELELVVDPPHCVHVSAARHNAAHETDAVPALVAYKAVEPAVARIKLHVPVLAVVERAAASSVHVNVQAQRPSYFYGRY